VIVAIIIIDLGLVETDGHHRGDEQDLAAALMGDLDIYPSVVAR
jgi:hypothetical protein